MIVVKIEMWPSGNESHAREIGRTYIANVGGTAERGDYRVAVCRRNSIARPRELYADQNAPAHTAQYPKATRTARVEGYPRLSYNVWRLILRSLRACFPEETAQ
jgi:hypothetical protein